MARPPYTDEVLAKATPADFKNPNGSIVDKTPIQSQIRMLSPDLVEEVVGLIRTNFVHQGASAPSMQDISTYVDRLFKGGSGAYSFSSSKSKTEQLKNLQHLLAREGPYFWEAMAKCLPEMRITLNGASSPKFRLLYYSLIFISFIIYLLCIIYRLEWYYMFVLFVAGLRCNPIIVSFI